MIANSIIIISNKVVKKGLYVRFMEVIKKTRQNASINSRDSVQWWCTHLMERVWKSMKGKTNNWDPLFEFNFATFFPILLDTLVDLLCCCKQDFFY